MSDRFAERLRKMSDDPAKQVEAAYCFAISRTPTADESQTLVSIVREHGLANACRLIFNTNEFAFEPNGLRTWRVDDD